MSCVRMRVRVHARVLVRVRVRVRVRVCPPVSVERRKVKGYKLYFLYNKLPNDP